MLFLLIGGLIIWLAFVSQTAAIILGILFGLLFLFAGLTIAGFVSSFFQVTGRFFT